MLRAASSKLGVGKIILHPLSNVGGSSPVTPNIGEGPQRATTEQKTKNDFGLNYEKHKIFLLAAIIGLRLNIIDEAGSIFIQCRFKLKTGVSHSSHIQLLPVRERPVAAVPSPAVPHVPPALTNCVS